MYDVENSDIGDIPNHLKDAHYAGAEKLGRGVEYKYPHNYPNHWIEQQYLPDELNGKTYYTPGENKNEKAYDSYWKQVKENRKNKSYQNSRK